MYLVHLIQTSSKLISAPEFSICFLSAFFFISTLMITAARHPLKTTPAVQTRIIVCTAVATALVVVVFVVAAVIVVPDVVVVCARVLVVVVVDAVVVGASVAVVVCA